MKYCVLFVLLILLSCSDGKQKPETVDIIQLNADLASLLDDLKENYIYVSDKEVDFICIKEHYISLANKVKHRGEDILLFEHLLDEFYDSHLILSTNIDMSYRLHAPIYVTPDEGKYFITQAWYSQVNNFPHDVVGAEIVSMNDQPLSELIEAFPTACHDKSNPDIHEWLANKVIAGRYDQYRILQLKNSAGEALTIDLDELEIQKENKYLSTEKIDDFGIITVNNSLGRSQVISKFDGELEKLMDTKGLIMDLRNTVDGGDSYIARGIMSRFIEEEAPYQKHSFIEDYGNHPPIERVWLESVAPRGDIYKKPVIVLVGRWTGSMGEGLAIGMEAIGRGTVVGTEMERLAGSNRYRKFEYRGYGYRTPTEKLYHVNGTPREDYVPDNYVVQKLEVDVAMETALGMLR